MQQDKMAQSLALSGVSENETSAPLVQGVNNEGPVRHSRRL